jgi:regulator of sigma E protease
LQGEIFMTSVTPTLVSLMKNLFFIAVGLAGIGLLITVHEFGHFIFAKIFKVSTPSFSIGFGPRLLQRKIGDTTFAFSAIPLGGYVEMAGAAEVGQGEQEQAHRKDRYSFAAKPYYQKLLIMSGGILFNILFAYIVLIGLFATGIPKTPLLYPKTGIPIVESVKSASAAAKAGLQSGDRVIAVRNGDELVPIATLEQLLNQIEPTAENTTIRIERKGLEQDLVITFDKQQAAAKKGESPSVIFQQIDIPGRSFSQAVREGIRTTHQIIRQTFLAFKGLFTQRSMANVGGPLMVISQTIKGAERGTKIFLLLLAFISVNLAVLNLFPLPILDGGQIFFYTIEALIGRPLPEQAKLYIHYASWFLVLGLALYLSVKDLARMITSFKS